MIDRLNSNEWSKHYNPSILTGLVNSLLRNELSDQTQEMIKHTVPGDNILEIGCGSGATSLYLSLHGRRCTALDFAEPALDLVNQAALRLNCSIETIFADATQKLPFMDNGFDVVFQAGLLEHFNKEERIKLLREWGRVGKRMISIIPNASSIAYRVGKSLMEKSGTWPYGLELPQYSLFDEFSDVGFRVLKEYTIGELHALNFLPRYHPLRLVLHWWLKHNTCDDNCGQGYLLVTIGQKYENS